MYIVEENSNEFSQLASCERDLHELGKLRIKTLEDIIQDKLVVIERLNNECQAERTEKLKLIDQLRERQSVLSNYESRFLQVRTIIEKQDAEIRSSHETLETVREQLASEEAKTRELTAHIETLSKENREQLAHLNLRAEESSADAHERFKRQLQEFEQKLTEKEKWLEAMQIRHASDLQAITDTKDKEINGL